MKNIILLFAGALTLSLAEAQNPTVIVIGQTPEEEIIKEKARIYFENTHEKGFKQSLMPRFIFTDKSSKAIFTIGGFVNFRTAYDFDNVLPNLDFITYQIPMSSTVQNEGRILMDASTSRLYFKGVLATQRGPLVAYAETDFRGPGNSLRLREAYVSYMGFTLGQKATTFCDLGASFNTVDFQGPNGYTYGRNLMIQYKYKFTNGISMALAAEYPVVSATYGSSEKPSYQRLPDIPAYVQYAWNENQSHIRASGIIRNLDYYSGQSNRIESTLGWGAQLSGSFKVARGVELYGNAVYGQGISAYVVDLQGVGMDMTPSISDPYKLSPVTTLSWLVGAQVNITKRMPLTVGYSQVSVFDQKNPLPATDYRIGQYCVANLFYNISPSWNVGLEYLHGIRTNIDGVQGHSNRIQAAVQLNF